MKQFIIKTMNQFKDNLIKAGTLAIDIIFCSDYIFELDNITFNIDYDGTSQMYEVCDCTITFNYGSPNGEPWYRENKIDITNFSEYNLDDMNYLYGLFYGYFSSIEQAQVKAFLQSKEKKV